MTYFDRKKPDSHTLIIACCHWFLWTFTAPDLQVKLYARPVGGAILIFRHPLRLWTYFQWTRPEKGTTTHKPIPWLCEHHPSIMYVRPCFLQHYLWSLTMTISGTESRHANQLILHGASGSSSPPSPPCSSLDKLPLKPMGLVSVEWAKFATCLEAFVSDPFSTIISCIAFFLRSMQHYSSLKSVCLLAAEVMAQNLLCCASWFPFQTPF